MSVLETPRVYFRGNMSWDPIVTNNDSAFYDEGAAVPLFDQVADKVTDFRQRAVGDVFFKDSQGQDVGSNWNPHGTHRARFFSTAICAVDSGAGPATADAFVTAPVSLTGMLVDLEPYGAFSSQLFFDVLRLGIDGGCRIVAPRSARITARYINFDRNRYNPMIAGVASVIWQTSFSKADGLRVDAHGSTALAALAGALEGPDVLGLTVRFNTYRTIYFNDPSLTNGANAPAFGALQAKLTAGGFQPNPARSRLVGVVGLWRAGEPAHEPGERVLIAQRSGVGTAFARVGNGALTLDLSNSIPEAAADLSKTDFGPLSVTAAGPAGPIPLGVVRPDQYDRAAYEASAGVAVVPLSAAAAQAAAGAPLQIAAASGPLFVERPLRAVPLSPNIYLDEGASAAVQFQLYRYGAPAPGPRSVTVYTLDDAGVRASQITSDGAGLVTVPVAGPGPGIVAYVAAPSSADPAPSQGINPLVNTYAYVRTLPADAAIAALAPSWTNVYANVLADWDAMAPCMDNWLRLGRPEEVMALSGLVRGLTDPAHFEDFRFMPVTRDMSAGKRALLHAFLGQAAPAGTATLSESAPAADFNALSRHMRGGQ